MSRIKADDYCRCLRCGQKVEEFGYAPDSSLGFWAIHFTCSSCSFMWLVADDGSLEYYDDQKVLMWRTWIEIEIGLLPIFKEEELSYAMQTIPFG